jgi:hypothetical protein
MRCSSFLRLHGNSGLLRFSFEQGAFLVESNVVAAQPLGWTCKCSNSDYSFTMVTIHTVRHVNHFDMDYFYYLFSTARYS